MKRAMMVRCSRQKIERTTLMLWSDSSVNKSVQLTAKEFKVIFQVTKELHILPAVYLRSVGWRAEDIMHLQRLLWSIRGRMEGISYVRIDFQEVVDEDFPLPPSISEVDRGEGVVKRVVSVFPCRLRLGWKELVEAGVSVLGERELFLRAGYEPSEVLEAARRLSPDAAGAG
ncbi:hypothetical protein [Nonomuraea sp. NPDC002799]